MSEDMQYRECRDVSATFAARLVEAAMRKAEEIGKPMVIAIVDQGGVLKEFRRMDGAPLLSVEIAKNKAYTAAAFGISTGTWFDFIQNDEPLALGIPHTPGLIVYAGGYPIRIDGFVVGGIGVSGGHYSDDAQVAAAALEACGLVAQ
ncbi:MAG TPA: heme-binding protein [Acidimicrobiales bacterium]|nr:heme-binding protein [Acidimicrobiales bacterium]